MQSDPTDEKNTNSIPAQLDLAQSLSTFESLVEELLNVETIDQWDASVLMDKERAMRNGALVLAGQCIALLLFKLASHPNAPSISNEKTQGLRSPKSQSKGRRRITLTTVGNVSVGLNLSYVVRESLKGMVGKRSGEWITGGYYPFLEWLGLSERVSPLVWSTIAEYGMVSASFASAQGLLQSWGIHISPRRVKRLTYRFGQIGLAQRSVRLEQLAQGRLKSGGTLANQRVVISVDGGRSRLRRNKRGRRRKTTGRHGFYGDWTEPLLLTIYAVDEQGHKINTREIPITNDGTFAHYKTLLKLLEMHLVSLGIAQCRSVLFIADGARWMWKHIPPLLHRLGVEPSRINQLIDFYHAVEHLQAFSQLCDLTQTARERWVKKNRSLLKRGHFQAVLSRMNTLLKSAKGDQQAQMTTEVEYFSAHPQRFDYKRVSAMNLPIGSGSIESLVRQVVNLRLKGNGKFWLEEHAEIMLHGRCQWAAGSWEKFSRQVLTAGLG